MTDFFDNPPLSLKRILNEPFGRFSGLVNTLKTVLLAKLNYKKALFIVSTEQKALQYKTDLENLFGIDAHIFPSQEISPYEMLERNKFQYSEQIKALINEPKLIVAPVKALLERFPSKEFLIRNKILIKNTTMKIAKENIIVSLRKELKFQKLLNRNLLNLKEYADKNSNAYKKNYDNICKYRAQMHEDLSGFVFIIDGYEKDISKYKKEKELMIKTNESLINYKKEEQKKMKEKLEKLNNDTENQNNKIEKLRKILREYRNQNEEYYGNMEKNELIHLKKYEKLISEYKRLENLYQYYFDLEMKNMRTKMDSMNENLLAEEKDSALLKLKEKQVMGDFLRNIIRDIQTQMGEIDRLNKRISEDRKVEKILGKKGAEKYRQRLNEKYKSELSTLNTRYNVTFTTC